VAKQSVRGKPVRTQTEDTGFDLGNWLGTLWDSVVSFFKSFFSGNSNSDTRVAPAGFRTSDNMQTVTRTTGYTTGFTPPALASSIDTNGLRSFTRQGIAVVDFDGSPTAYGPDGLGDDFLANAGHPGKWWGVATDKSGNPLINPENGYYVSTTSWASGPRGVQSSYVDAQKIPYVAMNAHDKANGARNGDFVLLTNEKTGRQAWAVVADYAGNHPNDHTEVSAAAARALGLKFNKRGVEGHLSMQFFPGTSTGIFPSEGNADYIAMGPQSLRSTQYASTSFSSTVTGLAGDTQRTAQVSTRFNGNATGFADTRVVAANNTASALAFAM
jgi:hypothetical protein